MDGAVQKLIAERVKLGTAELIKGIDELGEEGMVHRPNGTCRSALDQAAECALITMYSTQSIADGGFEGEFDFPNYQKTKDKLAENWEELKAMLTKNADDFAAVVSGIPDEKLSDKLKLPWGELSYEDVMVYPYWNLSYHMGQVTYIGFLKT